jgi:hypothetical protein
MSQTVGALCDMTYARQALEITCHLGFDLPKDSSMVRKVQRTALQNAEC